MHHRNEIDGLRALAVVPVLLFHAGFDTFSGGFVGVDIFFVISGYLITTIIIEDMEQKRFSIVNFYERRARRILPALFLVMLVCIPFSWFWMLPDPLENFGQAIVATTLFSNNILLYITSGYWELASEFKPLLHTWSLGVEEQYYVFFPVFIILTWRFGMGKIFGMLIIMAAISLALSEWASTVDPEANFYLAPTRVWEIFAGSIVAFMIHKRGVQSSNLVSFIGLAAIIAPVFIYDETTPFPGLYALAPVLGTLLLIMFADRKTLVAKILGNPLISGTGLISYSAYLWHQPLLAFAKVYERSLPGPLINSVLLVATFILAFLTWKFVENPFRNRNIIPTRVAAVSLSVMAVCLLAFGYSAHKTHGFVSRIFDENIATRDLYIKYNHRNYAFRAVSFPENDADNVLVFGDSFGRDAINVLREAFDIESTNLVYRDDFEPCEVKNSEMASGLLKNADIVIISFINLPDENYQCIDEMIEQVTARGADIFVIGTKHFGSNLNWIARVDRDERALLRNPLMEDTIRIEATASAAIPSEHYISIMDVISNEEGVVITDEEGQFLSGDRTHLTRFGASYIAEHVFKKSKLSEVFPARVE